MELTAEPWRAGPQGGGWRCSPTRAERGRGQRDSHLDPFKIATSNGGDSFSGPDIG
ncbi:hypothetical protein CCACVL1_13377 [Corchorus capsularis]|uniref:Uncharacterized protein n=1 Tax=Corchorus capsularis TaxID=210143 RepID=A0A1R3IB73_COCAP|nr:hypothetical protein CCACVL1_13377 [Corchorus capsularis]